MGRSGSAAATVAPAGRRCQLALVNRRAEHVAGFLRFDDGGQLLALSRSGELFDSADAGRTWQRRAQNEQLPGFDPGDVRWGATGSNDRDLPAAQIVSGGGDVVWIAQDSQLFRSVDRGQRFDRIVPALPEQWVPRRIVRVNGAHLLLDVWRRCRYPGEAYGGLFAPACPAALATSDDNGTTWRLLPARWWDWSRLHFFTALEGVRADLREVWRTRDGGVTWQRIFVNAGVSDPAEFGMHGQPNHAPGYDPLSLVHTGHRRLWALFENALYRSDDGGERWARVELPTRAPGSIPAAETTTFAALHFADENHGWIVGGGGQLMSTRDGGNGWRHEDSGTTQRLTAVAGTPGGGPAWLGGVHNMIFIRPDAAPSSAGAASLQARVPVQERQ
jgi:hypothetical protein